MVSKDLSRIGGVCVFQKAFLSNRGKKPVRRHKQKFLGLKRYQGNKLISMFYICLT
jgi:hypothetical protein